MPKNSQQPLQHLRATAVKVAQGANAPITKLTEAQILQATAHYFLRAGLDYKGQFQCCFETKGGGAQLDASIDPGKIFGLGFLSTEISFSGSCTKSNEAILVAQRGPSKMQYRATNLTIPQPIMINCLAGVHWEGGVKAGIEVTVGISYTVGSDGAGETESTFDEEEEGGDTTLELEGIGIGFKAEAKAGFEAEAGYTYERFFAVDVCPLPFDHEERTTKVSAMLGELFTAPSYKALMKKRACDFASSTNGFEKIRYAGRVFGHISSADICTTLAKGIDNRDTQKSAKENAKSMIDSLQCWADKESQPKVLTSVFISSHKAEGKAGLIAKAEISVQAVIAQGKMGASAEGPTVGGEYKSATVRYQTAYSAPLKKDYENKFYDKSYVVMTQDTKIVYKKIEFTALKLSADASAGVLGYSKRKSTDQYEEVDEALTFGNKEFLNRITYTTATVFWHMHYPSRAIGDKAYLQYTEESFFSKKKEVYHFPMETLPGTGVSLGGSFLLENLLQFYEGYDPILEEFARKSVEKYFTTLAASLGVGLPDVIKFLTDPVCESLLKDLKNHNEIEAVLVEASFAVAETDITLIHTVKEGKELTELAPDTAKKILDRFKISSNKRPEAIRIRYRMQDAYNRDSDFKLGFKIAGTGAGITLKKVDRAGSEAIVDLHTVWMDATRNSSSSLAANYEDTVPIVALFCQ